MRRVPGAVRQGGRGLSEVARAHRLLGENRREGNVAAHRLVKTFAHGHHLELQREGGRGRERERDQVRSGKSTGEH